MGNGKWGYGGYDMIGLDWIGFGPPPFPAQAQAQARVQGRCHAAKKHKTQNTKRTPPPLPLSPIPKKGWRVEGGGWNLTRIVLVHNCTSDLYMNE